MVFMAIWYFPFILCLLYQHQEKAQPVYIASIPVTVSVLFLIRFKIKPRDSQHFADFLESCVPQLQFVR